MNVSIIYMRRWMQQAFLCSEQYFFLPTISHKMYIISVCYCLISLCSYLSFNIWCNHSYLLHVWGVPQFCLSPPGLWSYVQCPGFWKCVCICFPTRPRLSLRLLEWDWTKSYHKSYIYNNVNKSNTYTTIDNIEHGTYNRCWCRPDDGPLLSIFLFFETMWKYLSSRSKYRKLTTFYKMDNKLCLQYMDICLPPTVSNISDHDFRNDE
jgi:hypothetical protein